MKFLAIGDFHGEFPKKFEKLIRDEKIDLVVSNGDFFPFVYRKLWFKHCYGKKTELWEIIGKEKTKKLVEKDLRLGERALRALNRLSVPVITVPGNIDHLGVDYNDQYGSKLWAKSGWKWYDQNFFVPILKKYSNIQRFDYSYIRFGAYIFIGARGGTSPGSVTSISYRKHRKILDNLFIKFKDHKILFISHNVPNNTQLDKIGKYAHKKVRGKHYGSKLIRRVIDRWQPLLHIGGHIHEGRGMQKLGKTLCVNPGAAHEGQAAVIEIKDKNVKVKFIR